MSEILFKHIAQMQYDLNEDFTPSWTKKGLDWDLAIISKCDQALESLPSWKWWKLPAPDNLPDLKVECIDLLHLIVSKQMELRLNNLKDIKSIAKNKTTTIKADDSFFSRSGEYFYSIFQQQLKVSETTEPPEYPTLIKSVLRYSLVNDMTQATRNLFVLFIKLGMSMDDVYREYMSKCVLNHYRKARGYDAPDIDYLTVINGKEDSDHVRDIIDVLPGKFLNLEDLKDHIFIAMDNIRAGFTNHQLSKTS